MQEKLAGLINQLLKETKYTLIDLVIRGEKRSKVLEVYVDSVKDMDLEMLGSLNYKLNELVESDSSLDFSRVLVSSPGVDRPFRFSWQLVKHIGRTLEIETCDGEIFFGKLTNVSNESELKLEEYKPGKKQILKSTGKYRAIKFSDIKKSKVLISFK